ALLGRTAVVCAVLTAMAAILIGTARPLFSQIIFGRANETSLVVGIAGCLAILIVFNYLSELLTALRLARATCVVQFFQSLLFAGFSILFLMTWQHEAVVMVVANAISYLLLSAGIVWFLRGKLRAISTERPAAAIQDGAFWSRLLSFAAWVWITNLLFN